MESPLITLMAPKTRRSHIVPDVEAENNPHSVIAKLDTYAIVPIDLYWLVTGFDCAPVARVAGPACVPKPESVDVAATVPVPESWKFIALMRGLAPPEAKSVAR